MISVRTLPHDRIEFRRDEVGDLQDLANLPWAEAGIAKPVETRVGVELRIGPHVGRLVIPQQATIDIAETYPGTVATCLSLTKSGRRAGDQDSPASEVMVSPWSAIVIRFQEALSDYVLSGIERRYFSEMVTTSRPRGHIDIKSTVTRAWSRGRNDQVICVPRILTDDTPLNRVVAAAAGRAEQLLLRERISDSLRQVRLALRSLSGVRRDLAPNIAAARSSLDPRSGDYADLLSLAELLIEGIPAIPPSERQDPDYPMSAWINIDALFEDAVRYIAKAVVGDHGSVRAGLGDGVTLFHGLPEDPVTRKKSANPDVVIRHKAGTLLLDAKYRRHEQDFTDDELYQLMAHAGAYQASAAALVAPVREGVSVPQPWIGRDLNGVAYYVISVDPSSPATMYAPIETWIRMHLTQPRAKHQLAATAEP